MAKVGRKPSGRVPQGAGPGLCACGKPAHGRQKDCITCRRARLLREKASALNADPDQASIDALAVCEAPAVSAEYLLNELAEIVNRRANDADIVQYVERTMTLPPGDGWRGDQRLSFLKYPISAKILRIIANPGIERIVVIQGTQTGKSTWEMCALTYFMERGSGNIIYVVPTEDLQKKIPQTKMLPIWERSPEISFASTELDGKRLVWKDGRYIWMALGSKSHALVDTSGVLFGFITEYDEFHPDLKHDVVGMTNDRIRFTPRHKLIISGTPKRLDRRGLFAMYNECKRYEAVAPCPHCGCYMRIDETMIKYPPETNPKVIKQKKLAWVECPECGENCTDAHHQTMMENADLVDLDPELPEIWSSVRVPSWFSTKYSFSEAIAEFLEASNDPIKLGEWYKSVAAKPVDTMSVNSGTNAAGSYEQRKSAAWSRDRQEIPPDVHTITAGVDVGVGGYWLAVLGWGFEGRKYVLWSGFYEPKGPSESDWDNAWARVVDRSRMVGAKYLGNGPAPKFRFGLLDSGFNAPHCYKCCRDTGGAWVPAKGYDGLGSLYKRGTADPENKHNGAFRTLPLLLHHTHQGQELLESSLLTSIEDPNGIAFAWDEGKRLFEHLRGAVKRERPNKSYYWGKD